MAAIEASDVTAAHHPERRYSPQPREADLKTMGYHRVFSYASIQGQKLAI